MLGLALLFFIIAIVAGILGFTCVMLAAAGIAKIIFFIFLILLLITLLMNVVRKLDSTVDPRLSGNTGILGWAVAFFVVALIAGFFGFIRRWRS